MPKEIDSSVKSGFYCNYTESRWDKTLSSIFLLRKISEYREVMRQISEYGEVFGVMYKVFIYTIIIQSFFYPNQLVRITCTVE